MFFFFQAEDGIRDIGVTGVQTCALPISSQKASAPPSELLSSIILATSKLTTYTDDFSNTELFRMLIGTVDKKERSEERRVGKECRSRRKPDHKKKKDKKGNRERQKEPHR